MPAPDAAEPLRVVIVGGGPGGACCALTLLNGSRQTGFEAEVKLLEPKLFGEHYNQCAGVMMQDKFDPLLEEWGIELPEGLVQRTAREYVLHTGEDAITLSAEEGEGLNCSTRRVQLDEFILAEARRAGAMVSPARMTDLEFTADEVVVYTDAATYHADVVIGAFGLDPGTAAIFAGRTGYRPPPCISTLVTKLHPAGLDHIEGLLGDQIHAFLPRLAGVEFGALVPKGNHICVIVAGQAIGERDIDTFLKLPEVSALLPEGAAREDCFKGAFPVGVARNYCGGRYLMGGDAAGLVRPFKGGGITAAMSTGRLAAISLTEHGVSAGMCADYAAATRHLRLDVSYGRALRLLVSLLTGPLHMGAIIALAQRAPAMREILYECVSGRSSYRDTFRQKMTGGLLLRAAWAAVTGRPRRRGQARQGTESG